MADVERLLLSKAINEQDMRPLIESKIDKNFFIDAEHLQVLGWMNRHYRSYGTPPGIEALRDNHPTWKVLDTPEPYEYYIDRVRLAYRYDVLQSALADAVDLVTDDIANTDDAQKLMQRALADISDLSNPLRDHNLTDPVEFSRVYDFYEELAKNPGELRGLSTGWPTLDLATMGLQPGQLVTFVGPPKAGKSTVLLSSADEVALTGNDVLFLSFEMSYDEMVARWIAKRARLNYRRLLKGKMNEHDVVRLNKLEKQLEKARADFIMSEDVSSTTTVSGVIAKLQEHRPKALFIDGVYLMDDENGEPKGSSQAITNITRSLKRVAQLFGIPVVITTQTLYSKMRGQSVKASSIGYSSSFGQDSDVVIAIEPRESQDGGEDEHWLKVLLSRSGPHVEVRINFDWSTSAFSEYADTVRLDADPDEEDDGEIMVGLRSGTH